MGLTPKISWNNILAFHNNIHAFVGMAAPGSGVTFSYTKWLWEPGVVGTTPRSCKRLFGESPQGANHPSVARFRGRAQKNFFA